MVCLINGRKNKSSTERVYCEPKNKTKKIFELILTVFDVVVGAFLLEFLVRRLLEGKKIKIKRRKENGCYINSANVCMKFFPLPPPSLLNQKRNLIMFQFFCDVLRSACWQLRHTRTHKKLLFLIIIIARCSVYRSPPLMIHRNLSWWFMEIVNFSKNGSPERLEPLVFESPRNISERKHFPGTYTSGKDLRLKPWNRILWKRQENVQIVLLEMSDPRLISV